MPVLEGAMTTMATQAAPRRGEGGVTAAISADKLTKRFGRLTAVDELSLDVHPGEVVGFLGPNGAGKTTTIRMLLGFIWPTSGRVRVLGGLPSGDAALRRRIGYLPGDFRIDPALTGNDLFTWFGELRGGLNRKRVAELIERLQ